MDSLFSNVWDDDDDDLPEAVMETEEHEEDHHSYAALGRPMFLDYYHPHPLLRNRTLVVRDQVQVADAAFFNCFPDDFDDFDIY